MTITLAGFTGHLGQGVSPREMECLLSVAAGLTTKEVARDLGVAPGTINKRLLALTTKLGVTRRAALVAKAFAMGLISLSTGMIPTPQNQQQDQNNGVFIA